MKNASLAAAGAALSDARGLSGQVNRGSGNRAVVYLYLFGGDDSNNAVIPLDRYSDYAASRGPLAVPAEDLLPVTARGDGPKLGFHPALGAVRDLFEAGSAAIVANVGETAGFDFRTHRYPRLSFAARQAVSPAWATAEGTGRTLVGRSRAVQSAPRGFPDTGLGREMARVWRTIRRRWRRGVSSQVYLVAASGFDTHRAPASQAGRYEEISQALAAFYRASDAAGLAQNVTTVTSTEFNRALRPNGHGGSDHGWGGHRIVVGGSVLGGAVYGEFPSLRLGGADDATGDGVWRPTTAEDLFEATLAGWMGATHPRLAELFPALGGASSRDLGFLV